MYFSRTFTALLSALLVTAVSAAPSPTVPLEARQFDPQPTVGPGPNQITIILYPDPDFGGKPNPNPVNLGDQHFLGTVDNKNVESLKIPPGFNCRLFGDYIAGQCAPTNGVVECTEGNTPRLRFPNQAVCLICTSGPCPRPA